MIQDPSVARVAADLEEGNFLNGCAVSRWRIVSFAFPTLDFMVSSTEPDGTASEYGFRAELSRFPAQPPMVRIWDHEQNIPLPQDRRPKGGQRVQTSFQCWGSDTVYRPWDRLTGSHNSNAARYPHLAWHPHRRLAFVFEDLHAILNSNAHAQSLRTSA